MLFNSPEFLLFLPIVFGLYWFVVQQNLRAQNVLLLISSYVFYGWWDWRFLGLIAFSTVVDFFVGIRVHEASEKRIKKRWMAVSLLVNLGLLAYFKYAKMTQYTSSFFEKQNTGLALYDYIESSRIVHKHSNSNVSNQEALFSRRKRII